MWILLVIGLGHLLIGKVLNKFIIY